MCPPRWAGLSGRTVHSPGDRVLKKAPPSLSGSHRGGRAMSPLRGPVHRVHCRGGGAQAQSSCHARLQAPLPSAPGSGKAEAHSGVPLRPWLPATQGLVLLGAGPGLDPRPPTAPAQEAAPLPSVHAPPGPGPACGRAAGSSGWRAQPRLSRPQPPEEARPAFPRVAAGLPPRQGRSAGTALSPSRRAPAPGPPPT